jgi:hypothetical protein
MFINLADKGIVQKGNPDLIHVLPATISAAHLLMIKMGIGSMASVVTPYVFPPHIITSGYRDKNIDPEIKNSPHKFGIALDFGVGALDKQIEWALANEKAGLFNRSGLYPGRGIIHFDIADDEWMKFYEGTKHWVCDPTRSIRHNHDTYKGFDSLTAAINYARSLASDGRVGAQT